MCNLKKGKNDLQNKNKVTNVENKLMVTTGNVQGGINWEIGIVIYTLVYIDH